MAGEVVQLGCVTGGGWLRHRVGGVPVIDRVIRFGWTVVASCSWVLVDHGGLPLGGRRVACWRGASAVVSRERAVAAGLGVCGCLAGEGLGGCDGRVAGGRHVGVRVPRRPEVIAGEVMRWLRRGWFRGAGAVPSQPANSSDWTSWVVALERGLAGWGAWAMVLVGEVVAGRALEVLPRWSCWSRRSCRLS